MKPYLLALAAVTVIGSYALAQQPGLGNDADSLVDYYNSAGLKDAVTKLQARLSSGRSRLEFEDARGYLTSVLRELAVPVDSQVLVWSKTSSQSAHTSPQTPRAIYFNDQAYVGWAKGDEFLDLIATDPNKGPIFFTLRQQPTSHPTFIRDSRCLSCHLSNKTLNVPGLLVRSVIAQADGTALSQASDFIAGHNNPLSERWGGWYVTGTHGRDLHMGNLVPTPGATIQPDLKTTSNIIDLTRFFNPAGYLSSASDTVALLVLDDAVRMENFITRAGFEAMHAIADAPETHQSLDQKLSRAAEPLLTYLLFRDEAPMKGPIQGTTDFARRFSTLGPKDHSGRSLREFDLNARLFRYSCNYRIYSPAFDALPEPMKDYLWRRLAEILSGQDQTETYKTLTQGERKNALVILLDTKPEFLAWMQSHRAALKR